MTEADRELHIAQALAQYQQQSGSKDTLRVPLMPGGMLLEVLDLPLDLPVLNAESFRIAPALSEHPRADLVRADPYSPAAQRIVATLVRDSHRYAEALKESLIDGQDEPGVITHTGKLINGNSRCVLLRELRAQGRITTSSIRVALLPADVVESQELELESILQKQVEHKDEYNLVSELMMLKKLHEGARMTDAAIARRLRMKSAQRVTDLRAVLDLMERARRLTDPILPVTAFINERDQAQNWLELLRWVREADQRDGRSAGDLVVERWLIPYMLGLNSVHKLRHATGTWVESDVLPDLADGDDIATTIAELAVAQATEQPEPETRHPVGVDVLGDESPPPPDADARAVERLLNLTVAATRAGDGDLMLDDGEVVPAADVREVLMGSVSRGLASSKRRSLAGNRLQRPAYGLTQARTGLKETLDALDEVSDLPEFSPHRENVIVLVDEITELLERVTQVVQESVEIEDEVDE
jgi:hypothetical protein